MCVWFWWTSDMIYVCDSSCVIVNMLFQLKVSIGFTKACEEMKLYQSLLDKPGEVEKLKATPNKPRRSIVRRKSSLLNRSQDDESNMSNASLNAGAGSSEATPKRESNSRAAGKRKSSSGKGKSAFYLTKLQIGFDIG